ncbi:MAG: hypothetical protein ACD_75C02128G0003, partial [uncultured bacterium]
QVPQPQPSLSSVEDDPPICAEPEESTPSAVINELQPQLTEMFPDVGEPALRRALGKRDSCYTLQPGAVKAKAAKTRKKSSRSVGCCQPQSLVYARCRSGLDTCRLGDTSPLQWFDCAGKNGNTTPVPREGSIMVLDGNDRRRMPTGHPVYVEEAIPNGNGSWLLRISHTNYDRQCHLDLNAAVHYDPVRQIASFQSGAWGNWARDLKVLGFIVR